MGAATPIRPPNHAATAPKSRAKNAAIAPCRRSRRGGVGCLNCLLFSSLDACLVLPLVAFHLSAGLFDGDVFRASKCLRCSFLSLLCLSLIACYGGTDSSDGGILESLRIGAAGCLRNLGLDCSKRIVGASKGGSRRLVTFMRKAVTEFDLAMRRTITFESLKSFGTKHSESCCC